MDYSCYIIFSKSADQYYIGYTSDLKRRIELHNSWVYGSKSYTHKAKDWEYYLIIPCKSIKQALIVEAKIKKMKSRTFIENLKKYPELVDKLLTN